MCSFSSSEQSPYFPLVFVLQPPCLSKKQHNKHLGFSLHERRRAQLQKGRGGKRMFILKTEIKMRNMKLYMENQSIIEENDKLRKQAVLLLKENQNLLFKLQKKFSEQNNNKTN